MAHISLSTTALQCSKKVHSPLTTLLLVILLAVTHSNKNQLYSIILVIKSDHVRLGYILNSERNDECIELRKMCFIFFCVCIDDKY